MNDLPPVIGLTGSYAPGRGSVARYLVTRWAYKRHARNHPSGRLINADVRFGSEAAMIRRLGGVIWRIEQPESPHVVAPPATSPLHPDAMIVAIAGTPALRRAVDVLLGMRRPEGVVG